MADNKTYEGQTYTNGSAVKLIAIGEPIKNSIECKCLICGEINSYKISDLKNNNILACKSCRAGLKIGDIIDTLEITGYTTINGKFSCRCACKKCGKEFALQPAVLKQKGFKCRVCNKEVQANTSTNTSAEPNKPFGLGTTPMIRPRVLAKAVARPAETKPKPVEEPKSPKKAPKNIVGNLNSFERHPRISQRYGTIGDFIFVEKEQRATKTGMRVNELLKGQCIHCGCSTLKSEKDFEKDEYKCKKCNKIKEDKRNIIRNGNWVGYIKHNIEVVRTTVDSNGTVIADTKCLACGYEMSLPIVALLTEPDITCLNCGDTKIKMECPLCHKPHITTTLRNLYRVSESARYAPCPNRNEEVPYSEIVLEHESKTRLENIRKKYKGYTLAERIPAHEDVPELFKFQEGYTGTDGERYNTCMCSVHNKLMVLRDDEILAYKHEFCADPRMLPYNPKIKPKKLH